MFVGDVTESPSIAIQGLWYGSNAFFDFSTRKFVQTQPVQLTQPLVMQTVPEFAGTRRRWTYDLDTRDFPDGDFAAYVVNNAGVLIDVLDYFSVYKNSTIGILPQPIAGSDS